MTDSAVPNRREVPQRWATPNSGHDRIVRWAKIALPSAVGVLLAILFLAPLDRKGDVSFILDKKKVDSAPERMRVESARYSGTDDKGQMFEMIANRAVQPSSDTPIVAINGMLARLEQQQGPMTIAADKGRYNIDTQQVSIDGPVSVKGNDGFTLNTSDVLVDLKQRELASQGPAQGAMRLGQFRANQIRADLDERKVVLDGGVRLKIVQGAVR
ncbi:LPS export ABC transporter periplasmic protein LptC [Sphingomonas flavescens]|jgi:lipopolysaccharide export system protein LptC|uniref:LPS export ABC transporter periplasmic protein LptC n=1 Tax=Sphingomonas flavescens TaxID=3132797 RepID=UPI002804C320|nr:LPS export ABC transporter periplasmic protein LptC [Sphingomonas limnosediminicola]